MKPIDPEMGNFKDNVDSYTEKRNQWGYQVITYLQLKQSLEEDQL